MPKIQDTLTNTAAASLTRTTSNPSVEKAEVGLLKAVANKLPPVSPFSMPSSLAFNAKDYEADDRYIKDSPVRRSVTNQLLRKPGVNKVTWREMTGIMEIGPSLNTSLPLFTMPSGFGLSLDAGFSSTGALTYRVLKPRCNSSGPQKKLQQPPKMPLNHEDAMKLPAGHEFEFRGAGKLQASVGITASAFAGVEHVGNAGVALSTGYKNQRNKEYSVSVQAINGDGLVRVVVTKTKERVHELSANLRVGVLKAMPDLPSFGQGALAKIADKAADTGVKALLETYGATTVRFAHEKADKEKVVCCFDLDLRKPAAQEAYFRLLMLSPHVVDRLMSFEDSGISRVRLTEDEQRKTRSIDFRALNSTIVARKKTDASHEGMLMKPDNSEVMYCDRVYDQVSSNYFTGSRHMSWEAITLKDREGEFYTYYRFLLERLGTMPAQEEINQYIDLAQRLEVKTDQPIVSDMVDMNCLSKFISSNDDIKVSMDIYFTEDGVQKIQEANQELGLLAFITANTTLNDDPELFMQLKAELESFYELDSDIFVRIRNARERDLLRQSYKAEFGRDLDEDYVAYKEARTFGAMIGEFCDINSSSRAEQFFIQLGKSGIDYPQLLCALSAIATRENLRVHELKLSGADLMFHSEDEGRIVHPRDEVRH